MSQNENLRQTQSSGDAPQILSGQPTIFAARIAKLPPFWREEPEIWFMQVDSSFNLNGITQDSTKYEYLLSHLDPSILFVVKDIIINPPAEGRYLAMKTRIIQHFAESGEGQLKKLLSGLELGDEKPSHLLQKMKSLASSRVSTDMLRTLFMERLPEKMKCILVVADTTDLDKLAGLADKISEQYLSTSMSIAEVSPKPNNFQETGDVSQKLDTIITRIEALERHSRHEHHSNYVKRTRSNSRNHRDSDILNVNGDKHEESPSSIDNYNFKTYKLSISTKYYNTYVLLFECEGDINTIPDEVKSKIEASVFYFDSDNKSFLTEIDTVTSFVKDNNIEVSILLTRNLGHDEFYGLNYDEIKRICKVYLDIVDLNEHNEEQENTEGYAEVLEIFRNHLWSSVQIANKKSHTICKSEDKSEIDGDVEKSLNDFEELLNSIQNFKNISQSLSRDDVLNNAEKFAELFANMLNED